MVSIDLEDLMYFVKVADITKYHDICNIKIGFYVKTYIFV